MSSISFSYIFGSSMNHNIQCIGICSDCICTGSKTGEIAIWKQNPRWEVGIICYVPEDTSCIGICIIPAAYEVQKMLSTQFLLVSLHSNSKIRTWDCNDGKCLAYSSDLFSEENELKFFTSNREGRLITAGKNEIFLVDYYRMQRLRYFSTKSNIMGCYVYQDCVFAADMESIYLFNLSNEDTSPRVIMNYEHSEQKKVIAYDGDLLITSRYDELVFLQLEGDEVNSLNSKEQKIKHSLKIQYADISSGKVIVGMLAYLYVYDKADLIRSCMSSCHAPVPSQIILNFTPKVYKLHENSLVLTDMQKIFIHNILTEKLEEYTFFLPDNEFPILNPGEQVTSRNIFINSEILYAIGTNSGRVILQSICSSTRLVYFNKKSEVTAVCLHKDTLIIAQINETLSFWELKLQQGTAYHSLPEKTIEVWTSHVKVMITIDYSKRNIDFFNEMSWKSSKGSWIDIVLGQCSSGALILISATTKEIVCYFQDLKSDIVKATMYLNLEYLAVSCANGNIYIFNMMIQAIEREITGDAVFTFDGHGLNNEAILASLDKTQPTTTCLEFYFQRSPKKALEVKLLSIGKNYFPCLHLNVTKLIKTRDKYASKIIEDISAVISGNIFKQAIFGINKTLSFKCNWTDSKHSNALRIAGLLSLGVTPPKIPPGTVSLIIYSLNPLSALRSKLRNYIDLDPGLVEIAEGMLKGKKKLLRKGRSMTHAACTNFSTEKYHCQRIYVSLLEVLSISISACHSIASGSVTNNDLISHLLKMLKSGEPGYVLLACELLGQGQAIFKDLIHGSQIEEITKELLLYSCKDFPGTHRNFFYKTAITLSLPSISTLIKSLSNEIKNNSLDPRYQYNILFMVEYLVLHWYLEAALALDDLCDFILVANELKHTLNNKEFTADLAAVLQIFISLLPMVAITSDHRFLVAGLPTGWINIYDFRTDKRWKSQRVFDTPVCAVEARETTIACYSSQESAVKTLKIDQGLFGGIMGQGEIKFLERFQLPEIEPLGGPYQDLLKSVKIRWMGPKVFSLTREDRKDYMITLAKI